MLHWALWVGFIFIALGARAQLLISEVFANPTTEGRQGGNQWFEVYNAGTVPIDLAGAQIRRLDGAKLEEVWRLQLPFDANVVAPQAYSLVAERRDLGVGLCLDVPLVVVDDPLFRFKRSGVQTLCIKPEEGVEDCALFSNSSTFPQDHSRTNLAPTLFANDDLRAWHVEDCQAAPKFYASPGSRAGYCHPGSAPLAHRISCDEDQAPEVHGFSVEVEAGQPPHISSIELQALDQKTRRATLRVDDADTDDALIISLWLSSENDSDVMQKASEYIGLNEKGQGESLVHLGNLRPGNYTLHALAEDRFGNQTRRAAVQQIQVEATPEPTIEMLSFAARKVSLKGREAVLLSWRSSAALEGNVSLWLRDSLRGDQEPLFAGLVGKEELQEVVWTPLKGGRYEIRALWTGEDGSSFSSAVPVEIGDSAIGCACQRLGVSTTSLAFGVAAALAVLWRFGRLAQRHLRRKDDVNAL